jgi:hypothetical protein
MRNTLLITVCLVAAQFTRAQSKVLVEQYAYTGSGLPVYVSPIAHIETSRNWYLEARYNYEDMGTFSMYAGKTFSWEKKAEYTFTPLIGFMAGNMQGLSTGLNMEISRNAFYFAAQSQFSTSLQDYSNHFFFSWSEAGIETTDWMYAGLSMQYTQSFGTRPLFEPGVLVAFTFKQWTFPLYAFNVTDNSPYFILGMNYEWKRSRK